MKTYGGGRAGEVRSQRPETRMQKFGVGDLGVLGELGGSSPVRFFSGSYVGFRSVAGPRWTGKSFKIPDSRLQIRGLDRQVTSDSRFKISRNWSVWIGQRRAVAVGL
jgi:hypothetical protein